MASMHRDLRNQLRERLRRLESGELRAPRPDDLTSFAPMGSGISSHDYYRWYPRTWEPFQETPVTEAAGGILFFDGDVADSELQALWRVLQVSTTERRFVTHTVYAANPARERFVAQRRIISAAALEGLFGNRDAGAIPLQTLTVDQAIWSFIEQERNRLHSGAEGEIYSEQLRGVMGGDGDEAREKLGFGFMVENGFHGVCRIWSRAWLVTK